MRRLSLIGIDAIWQLSLGCLLMRTIASFLRYTGYFVFFVFVALRPMSTAMDIAGRSVHLTTLFPGQA